LGVQQDDVFFESTRAEKIGRIRTLGCTHFIDDLTEVFAEESFPKEIRKFLFVPHGATFTLADVHPCGSWAEVTLSVLPMKEESEFQECIRILLRRHLGKETASFERLQGGRNSRVVRVDCRDGSVFAMKAYFQSPSDPRDRMGCEYRALTFLKSEGIHQIATPICNDPEQRIAVYEFLKGNPLHGEVVGNGDIDQAVTFLAALRKLATPEKAGHFGPASEACFSIREILRNVEERFERLEKAAQKKPSLASFLELELSPFRTGVTDWLGRFCQEKGLPIDQVIPGSARTLSPSDFGFHNALKLPEGVLFSSILNTSAGMTPPKQFPTFSCIPAWSYRRRHASSSLRG